MSYACSIVHDEERTLQTASLICLLPSLRHTSSRTHPSFFSDEEYAADDYAAIEFMVSKHAKGISVRCRFPLELWFDPLIALRIYPSIQSLRSRGSHRIEQDEARIGPIANTTDTNVLIITGTKPDTMNKNRDEMRCVKITDSFWWRVESVMGDTRMKIMNGQVVVIVIVVIKEEVKTEGVVDGHETRWPPPLTTLRRHHHLLGPPINAGMHPHARNGTTTHLSTSPKYSAATSAGTTGSTSARRRARRRVSGRRVRRWN